MISLERLLNGLAVVVDPFVVHDVRHQCSPPGGQMQTPTVHYTRSGSAVLELAGGAMMRVSRHTVIVVPARRRARIGPEGDGRRPATALASAGSRAPLARTRAGAGDPDIVTASARIRATYQDTVGLFDNLREPLVENLASDDPIRRSFEELLDEIAGQRPGCRAMVETLLRRCLILLLRRHFEHTGCRLSWPAALEDARLGRAVTAMHDRPGHCFTLPELAEVAGMSRSVFAARFAHALGQSPIEFLKALRLDRAAELLTRSDMPVKTIAARVGYSSRSSFTRAFFARHGVGPAAFRIAARDSAPGTSPAGPVGPAGATEVA